MQMWIRGLINTINVDQKVKRFDLSAYIFTSYIEIIVYLALVYDIKYYGAGCCKLMLVLSALFLAPIVPFCFFLFPLFLQSGANFCYLNFTGWR